MAPHKEEHVEEESASSDDEEAVALMKDSKQTDEERRVLRRNLRVLHEQIEMGVEDGEARKKSNDLFKQVRYLREISLDGDNLLETAQQSVKRVEQSVQVRRSRGFGEIRSFVLASSHNLRTGTKL